MSVVAMIVDAATGAAVQNMKFGRMPRLGSEFVLETGRQVIAQRVEVGKLVPSKLVSLVTVWVANAEDRRQA